MSYTAISEGMLPKNTTTDQSDAASTLSHYDHLQSNFWIHNAFINWKLIIVL